MAKKKSTAKKNPKTQERSEEKPSVERSKPVEKRPAALGSPGTVVSDKVDNSEIESVAIQAAKESLPVKVIVKSRSDVDAAHKYLNEHCPAKETYVDVNERLQVRCLYRIVR